MRALVTGAAGFVGQQLCVELLRDGWDVHGASLTGAPKGGTLHRWQRKAVTWHIADLRSRNHLVRAIDAAHPDAIFHLAAVSHVPSAEADPEAARAVNVGIASAILDIVTERRGAGTLDPVVVLAGSAEQYGSHDATEMPLAESAELRPLTVYARTKVEQEQVALERWRADGVRVIPTRPFNHTGPGQAPPFLVPSLVQRIRQAHKTRARTFPVGNLDVIRDFLHVTDVVRAYIFLALRGRPGEIYNICSGVGTAVAGIVDLVSEHVASAGVGRAQRDEPARPATDPALVRSVDVPILVGDPAKLIRDTSWVPRHDVDMAIADLVDFESFGLEDAQED